jgi:hypothetical protein
MRSDKVLDMLSIQRNKSEIIDELRKLKRIVVKSYISPKSFWEL